MKAKIVLEDGYEVKGIRVGHDGNRVGKMTVYPNMSGYQEILTNPAAYGQIAIFSYPMIGNYGINRDDYEAICPHLSGVIMRECCKEPSNYKMNKTLNSYLEKMKVSGLEGVDTRSLSRYIQKNKIKYGAIVDQSMAKEKAIEFIEEKKDMEPNLKTLSTPIMYEIPGNGFRIALIDLGLKQSLLKKLNEFGYHITVLPWDCTWEQITDLDPDAIFISSGPYVERVVNDRVTLLRQHKGELPIFGCGLGANIIANIWTCEPVCHRHGLQGVHAIRVLENGKIYFTNFNIDHVLKINELKKLNFEPTEELVNERGAVAFYHNTEPVMGCIYEPEGSPGADEGKHFFEKMKRLLSEVAINHA